MKENQNTATACIRRIPSEYRRVRVRIDGKGVHRLVNYNGLREAIGYSLCKRLLFAFISSGRVNATHNLRRGLRIEIFEN